MSIHAELSKEARLKLATQRRRSSIGSFVIAILMTILFGTILFLIGISVSQETPSIQVLAPDKPPREIQKPSRSLHSKPSPPARVNARVMNARTSTPFTLPSVDVPVTDPTFGLDHGWDNPWGSADGFDSGGLDNLPHSFGGRCSPSKRLDRLDEAGGTPECEEAILKALRWLKKTQNPNGSWGKQHQAAMTGLALLCYLGHCETPASEEFGDTVLNATVYLANIALANNGRIASDFRGHWCYEHAIATYALCECFTFCNLIGFHIPDLHTATHNSVQWILNSQNPIGGWNYKYSEEKRWDTSINVWHLQALRAAPNTGLKFNNLKVAIRNALQAVADTRASSGGFSYNSERKPRDGHYPLTGAGVLCFQQHLEPGHKFVEAGVKYIGRRSRFKFKGQANLYEHYYVSQAMINYGGEYWRAYNKMFRDELLKHQRADGSWPNPQYNPYSKGVTYNTCLCTLMLEVYYRYLPSVRGPEDE